LRAEADLIRDALLPRTPRFGLRLRWALAALAVVGCLALVLLVRRPPSESDGFVERGTVAPGGLDVLCIAPGAGAAVSASATHGRCAAGSLLKAVLTREPGTTHVAVVAFDESFKVKFMARSGPDAAGPAILPGHLQLNAEGALTFVALFSPRPITDGAITGAVDRARGTGAAATEIRRLPLPDAVQRVLVLQPAEASPAP
jgi:hypothetical protein